MPNCRGGGNGRRARPHATPLGTTEARLAPAIATRRRGGVRRPACDRHLFTFSVRLVMKLSTIKAPTKISTACAVTSTFARRGAGAGAGVAPASAPRRRAQSTDISERDERTNERTNERQRERQEEGGDRTCRLSLPLFRVCVPSTRAPVVAQAARVTCHTLSPPERAANRARHVAPPRDCGALGARVGAPRAPRSRVPLLYAAHTRSLPLPLSHLMPIDFAGSRLVLPETAPFVVLVVFLPPGRSRVRRFGRFDRSDRPSRRTRVAAAAARARHEQRSHRETRTAPGGEGREEKSGA